MTKIAEITKKARAKGMSYGQYVAVQWARNPKDDGQKRRKKRPVGCHLTERKDK